MTKRWLALLFLLFPCFAQAQTGSPVSNGIFVTTSDVLWFQYKNAIGPTFQTFRIQKSDGTIYDATEQATSWSVTCAGQQGTGRLMPVSGWLISVTAYINGAGIKSGQTYGSMYILPSMPAGGGTGSCVAGLTTATLGTQLIGSNMNSFYPISWLVAGGALISSPLKVPGFYTNNACPATFACPAAGANLSTAAFSCAASGNCTGFRVKFQTVHFTLTTDGNAANRQVCLVLKTGGGAVVSQSCAVGVQTASTTFSYDFAPGIGSSSSTVSLEYLTTLPANFQLSPTATTLGTAISNIQVGDQISNVWISWLIWNETT